MLFRNNEYNSRAGRTVVYWPTQILSTKMCYNVAITTK